MCALGTSPIGQVRKEVPLDVSHLFVRQLNGIANVHHTVTARAIPGARLWLDVVNVHFNLYIATDNVHACARHDAPPITNRPSGSKCTAPVFSAS